MNKPGFLLIGRIVGAHGVQGALRVRSHAESTAPFESGRRLLMVDSEQRERSIRIEWAKPHGRGLLVAFEGVTDRNAAEALAGLDLLVDREDLPPAEEGAYYWADLIGLDVYGEADQYLGKVTAVFPTGSNDVYVVQNGGGEVLVPALESVVVEIDLSGNTMRVDLPEGL